MMSALLSRRREKISHRRALTLARVLKHQQRKAQGRAVYRIEHDQVALEEMLRAAGFLKPDVDDHVSVETGLQMMIDAMILDHLTR